MDQANAKLLGATDSAAKKLAKMGITRVWDLILHLPLRYEDETHITPIAHALIGQSTLVEGVVIAQEVQFRPRRQLVVQMEDASGSLVLRFIHFYPSMQKQMALETRIRALGEVRHGFFGAEMVHPKIKEVTKEQGLATSLTPIYPTVQGLTQPTIRRLINKALHSLPLHDTLPEILLNQLNLPSFAHSIGLLHAPTADLRIQDLSDGDLPEWQRLKFDELLAQQLSMRLAYQKRKSAQSQPLVGHGKWKKVLLSSLPFKLTSAQQKVLAEIEADLAQNHPMHRLLQGDVGSGKTIVAALTILSALEAGFQAALMVPTEILAEQHYLKFKMWLEPLGIKVVWLTGSLRKKAKTEAVELIQSGEAQLAIGTHALFQDDVVFANLGLIIVDEQHRFGVAQRLALKNKGAHVHQLMMSATPIPRTLAMSFFADLDVSVIDELPPNRTPIVTKLVNAHRRSQVEEFVLKACEKKEQVYWVCPLIEESEVLQLQAASETYAYLSDTFQNLKVGLVHGKLKSAEKAEVMQEFTRGEIDILVATTVIEVGVDVPNASLMVIEHAERMGLAQLHQLRGRVGRGSAKSVCVLMFSEPLSDLAKARLKVIYEHTDGFEIARQDLNIRGPGEFLGARQSGVPMLRFANLEEDLHLLEKARDIVPRLLEEAPDVVQAHLQRWMENKEALLGV